MLQGEFSYSGENVNYMNCTSNIMFNTTDATEKGLIQVNAKSRFFNAKSNQSSKCEVSSQEKKSGRLGFGRSSLGKWGSPDTSSLTSSLTSSNTSSVEDDEENIHSNQSNELRSSISSLRSSLKGLSITKQVKKRTVSFGSKMSNRIDVRVHDVESLKEYRNELWWSTSEIDTIKCQLVALASQTNATDSYNMKTFLDAYQYMRVKFYECSNDAFEETLRSLSGPYTKIAKGYARQFVGLERLIGFDYKQREERAQCIRKSIIKYSKKRPKDVSALRKYAEALTERDINWARTTGNASLAYRQ